MLFFVVVICLTLVGDVVFVSVVLGDAALVIVVLHVAVVWSRLLVLSLCRSFRCIKAAVVVCALVDIVGVAIDDAVRALLATFGVVLVVIAVDIVEVASCCCCCCR